MPRAPKTRGAKLTRHLDGLAIFANEETSGETHKQLARIIEEGRKVLATLETEDKAGNLLGEVHDITAELQEVNPEMAAEIAAIIAKHQAALTPDGKDQAHTETGTKKDAAPSTAGDKNATG